jgi:CubicO group peptidase (beta-lactamase class C family)
MQTVQPGGPVAMDWGVQPSIAGRKGPVLVHGGSDGNWLAWVVLFPETNNGVLVTANATDDMGGDKATKAVLGALFPSLSPAK